MNYKEIINSIKKNEIKNVYLFYGEETYLIDDVLRRFKIKLIDPSFEQFNFTLFENDEVDYKKIIDTCETLPFMAEKRLVYLNGLDIFKGGSDPFSETGKKQFIEYIAQIPESTVVIFYGYSSIDGRKKIIKEIKKHGEVAEFAKLKEYELNRWIKFIFKKLGKSIGARELVLFKNNLDYLGRNPSQSLLDVENEIKKLVSFMGKKVNLGREDIDRVMGPNFHNDIFDLINSIEKRNFSEAIERLNNMTLEKKEPILRILTTLGNQIKNILLSKLLLEEGYSDREIASKLEIHPYVASKSVAQSKQFTVGRLRELLNLFLDADMMIKSGTMDEKLAMEMLVLKTCRR